MGSFLYIVDNLVVADGCKYREINAVKCIKALGLQFLCTGSGNYLAIKYDAYSMCIRAGCKTKRIEQVCFCIGYFHGNWFLGTGDDNRLRRILNQVDSAEEVYAMVSVPWQMTKPSYFS